MKNILSCFALTIWATNCTASIKQMGPVEIAFECSIFAVIASKSAPTPTIKKSWNTSAQNWLDEAYNRGGSDSDYQNVPQHILNDFEGLDKKSVFNLALLSYKAMDCGASEM